MTNKELRGWNERYQVIAAILLAGVLPYLVSLAAHFLYGDAPSVDERLHQFFELTGSCVGLTVALLLLLRLRHVETAPYLLWVAAALVVMGLLDAVHSLTPWNLAPGRGWLRHMATLLGGLAFTLVWVGPPKAILRRNALFMCVLTGLTMALAWSIIHWHQWMPLTRVSGDYSLPVKLANALGGLGFLAAALFFFRRHLSRPQTEELVFASHALLFGVAGMVFGFSDMWGADWWVWHICRLLAYLMPLAAGYVVLVDLVTKLNRQRNMLERSVAERTAELRRAHDELELRVAERTTALFKANTMLHAEVEAHRQAEEKLGESAAELGRMLELTDQSRAALLNVAEDQKEAEEALRVSLREKEILLREIHHRTKNNLQLINSLLNMQARRSPSAAVQSALTDTRNRIQAIAMLHELLYHRGDYDRLSISNFTENLLAQVQRSVQETTGRLRILCRTDPVQMDLDQAIPCSLLINELVTNSLKHAFPDNRTGEVIVEIRQITPQQARLRVTDNGVGFPPGVDMTRLETLGFQLVADLTRQLRGECRLENSRGAAVEIVFPLSVES